MKIKVDKKRCFDYNNGDEYEKTVMRSIKKGRFQKAVG